MRARVDEYGKIYTIWRNYAASFSIVRSPNLGARIEPIRMDCDVRGVAPPIGKSRGNISILFRRTTKPPNSRSPCDRQTIVTVATSRRVAARTTYGT